MVQQMKKITEDTLIPLSLVFALFGAVVWMAKLQFDTSANTVAIARLEANQLKYLEAILTIKATVCRVAIKVGAPSEGCQ